MAKKRKRIGGCIRCGRPLKSPEAQARGMGDTCAAKHAAALALSAKVAVETPKEKEAEANESGNAAHD